MNRIFLLEIDYIKIQISLESVNKSFGMYEIIQN